MANRIKQLRQQRKITLQQLSDKTDISISSLSAYENNKRSPKIENWLKLADFFNVSVAYLTGKSDLEENPDFNSIIDKLVPLAEKSGKQTHSEFLKIIQSVQDGINSKYSLADETIILVVIQSLKDKNDLLKKGHSRSLQAAMLGIFLSIRDILSTLNRFSTTDQTRIKQLHAAINKFVSSLNEKETKNNKDYLLEALSELSDNEDD